MVELALERFKHYASPEGMEYLEEKAKQPPTEEEIQMMNEREGYDVSARGSIAQDKTLVTKDVGFGKAKGDLDWVDPSKKFN
jgi:hypothetical protein